MGFLQNVSNFVPNVFCLTLLIIRAMKKVFMSLAIVAAMFAAAACSCNNEKKAECTGDCTDCKECTECCDTTKCCNQCDSTVTCCDSTVVAE